jgi:hypothetical protein
MDNSNKKYKVAVYINGQWRGSSFECSKYLKPFFEQFDVDYYIHTTNFFTGKLISLDIPQNKTYIKEILETPNLEIYLKDEEIEQIKQTYSPLVYFQMDDKQKNYEITKLRQTTMSSFFSIYGGYMCNKERKKYEIDNGIKYDFIIKIRPDILIKKDFNQFNKCVKEILENENAQMCEHSLSHSNFILNTDYPVDIFQMSQSKYFDLLDEWVESSLNGSPKFLSNLYLKYNIKMDRMIRIKTYIIRELYQFENLVDRYYNETAIEDGGNIELIKMDYILYAQNYYSNKDLFNILNNWNFDFDKIFKIPPTDGLSTESLNELAIQINNNLNEIKM